MALNCPSVKLNSGKDMPIFGLGTWKSPDAEVTAAVVEAVKVGYRHIDCAYVYGNEAAVGKALQDLFKEGVVKREDLFITSKLWNTFHSTHLVKPALEETLKLLQLDYIDLYLIHWPMAYEENNGLFPKDDKDNVKTIDVDYLDTWKGMEQVYKLGLAKSIGVSNFNHEQLERLLASCEVPPANNQVECHPYLNQKKLIDFCRANGNISVTAYSPLGSPDRPWAKEGEPDLLHDDKILSIAKKYNKAAAHVLIRYQIDRGVIVIPKSVTKDRIVSNAQVFDFKLSGEDIAAIDTFNKNYRFCDLSWVSHAKHYPFSIEY